MSYSMTTLNDGNITSGGIHFIILEGYVAYYKSNDQYKWLEKNLAKVDRIVTPWLVATWHPPWYSTYTAHYREAKCMKVAMEELLYEYGVILVFNCHGDGGNREKMAIEHADEPGKCPKLSNASDKFMGRFCASNFTSGRAAGNFCWDQQPEYSAYRESSFRHGIFELMYTKMEIEMFERSPYSLFEDLKPFSVGLNYHHHNSQVAM
ncbi:hypothetical protein P3L10_026462 [Capsicum annuum]